MAAAASCLSTQTGGESFGIQPLLPHAATKWEEEPAPTPAPWHTRYHATGVHQDVDDSEYALKVA